MVRAAVAVVVVADLALLAARFPSVTRKSQTFFNLIARGDLDLRLAEPEDDMSDDELARLNEALALGFEQTIFARSWWREHRLTRRRWWWTSFRGV